MDEGAVLDVEEVVEGAGGEGQGETEVHEPSQQEDPYSSKASREYNAWLKTLRDSGDPVAAKFARLAKDNHGQIFALKNELGLKGVDDVRGLKTLLDSVIHTDPERGELKGADAIAALQDSVREIAEIDERIASGDATALDTFGDAMKAGIVKMAPAILDMAAQMDPEGYKAAITPHLVRELAASPITQNFNALVDVLNEAPPTWLTPEQKTAWGRDQMGKVIGFVRNMSNSMNELAKKAPEPGVKPNGAARKDPISERAAQQDKRESDYHWNTNIAPKLDAHADAQFRALFAPYAKRLNLDATTVNALKMDFSRRVASTSAKDQAYISQIGRYRGMKNPDPATVLNYAKVNFDKHAKTVMEALVNERYKPFLNGKPKAGAVVANGKGPAPAQGIQIVTARPKESDIDHKNRTVDQIHAKIFPLKSGKVVQLRA